MSFFNNAKICEVVLGSNAEVASSQSKTLGSPAKALVNGTLEGKKVAVVLNPDEETGSTYSSEFIDSIAKKSDYALIFEGSEEIDNFTEARKGISHIDIFLKDRELMQASVLRKVVLLLTLWQTVFKELML